MSCGYSSLDFRGFHNTLPLGFLEAIEPAGCIYLINPTVPPTNINRLNYLHGGHHFVELLGHPVVSWFMNPIAYKYKYNEH